MAIIERIRLQYENPGVKIQNLQIFIHVERLCNQNAEGVTINPDAAFNQQDKREYPVNYFESPLFALH